MGSCGGQQPDEIVLGEIFESGQIQEGCNDGA